ncbi:MAG: hypothetical protein ACK44P_01295 [Bacteroidota bacterium]|jgi:hypothetical protein|nr:hypothetical protein [Sphingobacteriales bacterium]
MSKRIKIYVIFFLLVLLSLLKDDFTPDYLNTPDASFLAPQNLSVSRLSTVLTNPFFWFCSILYTIFFILIPVYVLYLKNELKPAKWCGIALSIAAVALYASIFLESKALDVHLIPKINRYFHSPIFTLFLVAAIKIKTR